MSYRGSYAPFRLLLAAFVCSVVCIIVCLMNADALAQASAPSSAKQKTNNSEEAAVFERILNRVRFENDGTEVTETEAVVRIQSQAGVEEFGQLVFGYSSATEKLEVEYVRVRKPDGQVVVTPESTAQDFAPDVLKEAPMYSDYRQRHISVAALQPGDTLEYRTVTRVMTPLAAGNFWYEYTFPKGIAVNEDRLEVDIPKAREVKLKTPARQPEIQETGDRRVYTWLVKDIQPERDKDKDKEKEEAEEEKVPDVQLTTFTGWKQVAEWYAKLQGERMTVDDSVRKKAEELAKGAETPTEKARRLYDFVARNVRYVSISLGIGRYQPHSAADVLQSGYGDCKDKHTLLSALLRAEGIQSYPALINSSRRIDVDVPSPAQFDHVITAARLGTGTGLTWLDTTPEVTPFGLILYQLRNKQAVLASEDSEGGLQWTPADSPVKTFMQFTLDGKFSEFGALDAAIDVTAQGDRDWPMRASFRRFSQAQWKDFVKILSASWGLPGDVDNVQLDPIEDTSKPFHLKYRLRQDEYFRVPSTSVNFRPIPPLGLPAIRASEKSVEPLDIGPAGEMDYRVRLQFPSNYTLHTPTPVKMSRDYGDYSSAYFENKGILEGERKLVMKVNELAAARRADYESFRSATQSAQDQLLSCTIATPSGQGARAAASKMEGTPEELHKAGVKALQSKDYRTAIDLLKRAVDADASLKDGWYDLGLAYAGANHHTEAIAAFRKQLELDPNHKHANGDLAMELQQTGKNDEAIAAYRKQLETTPYDKTTHKNLGVLLAQLGRDADARAELEAAAAIPPDDPETKMALAQVYGRLGEKAQSQELMKGLTGSTGTDSGQDIYAAALKSDIDPAQTESDAQQVLYDIGDQFDSGEMDRLGPSAFSSMRLVALAWARMGWAKFKRGENLAAMQFLTSAWLLSESGTVANRLGQALEKQGQPEKARHMYALAVVAGGSSDEVSDSRTRLTKLAGESGISEKSTAEKDIAQAQIELVQSRTVKLDAISSKTVSARFNLVFDSSPRPERAEFVDGDESLRSAGEQLRQKDFPVRFPDVSSVKVVRRGLLSCGASGCSIELLPIEKEISSTTAPAGSKK
jgi:tetratricopeptide (TPR) repeat protein/transglutaminase-like putative cysteine protease